MSVKGGGLAPVLGLCLALFLSTVIPSTYANTIGFETDEGSWISLDVSPSGDSLVFELLGDLYELPIEGGKARLLVGGSGFASQPRFSPDGKKLVFVSDRTGEDNLWLASADGTDLRQITQRNDGELISPSWSPDGRTIYVSQLQSRRSMNSNVELWAYPVDGSGAAKVSTPDMGRGSMLVSTFAPGAYGPAPTPSGTEVYFTAAAPRQHGDSSGPSAQIMKVNLATGSVTPVFEPNRVTFRPQLSADGRWLAYGELREGITGLRALNLQSGEEHWLIRDIGFSSLEAWASRDMLPGFAFSLSNDSLVFAYDGKIRQIRLKDHRVDLIPFNADLSLTLEPRAISQTTISDGPVLARLAKGAVISPDGTGYAFSTMGRIYRVTDSEHKPAQVTGTSEFGEFHPAWSPDGEWLAYVTWNAQMGGAVWKVKASGGFAEKITRDDAFYRNPAWSPDGKTIIAIRAPKAVRQENDRRTLGTAEEFVQLSESGAEAKSIAPAAGAVRPHFTLDENRFYAYSPRSGLASWNLDGTDQQSILKVFGSAGPASYPALASDVLIAPDHRHALATVANQLYLIDMRSVSKDQPSVNVYIEGVAHQKLTSLGADHFSWGNAQTIAWSVGSTLFKKTIGTEEVTEIQTEISFPRRISTGVVALTGARIITMDGGSVFEEGDILIEGNRIRAVGPSGSIVIPQEATRFDLRGSTIMPGIVDIHAHWNPKRSVLDLEDYNAYANLSYGVTALRDPQSVTDDIFVYSDAVATGEMVGPRIFSTGRGVFFFNNFQSYEQVYAVLARYKYKYRTHLLKAYLPGNRQVRQWIVRACKALNLIVTAEGGADAKMNITFALDGFSGTEHAVPIVPVQKDIVELFSQSGISYTPTLLVSFGGPFAADYFIAERIGLDDEKLRHFLPDKLIEKRIELSREVDPEAHIFPSVASGAREILEAGGNVGLGGHGEMQGLQVHWEMWAMAAGGMKNSDVLRVATLEGAKAIGLDGDIGSIEVGKLADLIVLDNNPLEAISHSNSVRLVMVNGVLYDASSLAEVWPLQRELPSTWWHGMSEAMATSENISSR